jgi:hypothetical protein
METSARSPRGGRAVFAEWVAQMFSVGAYLASLLFVLTFLLREGPSVPVRAFTLEAAASILLGGCSFGLFRRRRWAWGAAAGLLGMIVIGWLAATLFLARGYWTEPLHCGVNSYGIVLALTSVALAISAGVLVLFVREGKQYRTP